MDTVALYSEGLQYYTRDLPFAALDRFLLLSTMPGVDLANLWNGAGVAALKLWDYASSEQYLKLSLEKARESHNAHATFRALSNLVQVYLRANKAQQALAYLPELEQLSTYRADMRNQALTLGAVVYGRNQQWAEAVSRIRTVLSQGDNLTDASLRLVLFHNLGVYLNMIGETDEARTALCTALNLATESQNSDMVTYACSELARLSLRAGDWESALNYSKQALDYLWNHMNDVTKGFVARLCELFGWLALAMDDYRRGAALVERASTYYAEVGWWLEWGRTADLLRNGKVERPVKIRKIPEETVNILQYFYDLFSLFDTIEGADPDLSRRGQLVTHYALRLGAYMKRDAVELRLLSHAGRLCDIGLTAFEAEAVADEKGARYKLHAELGARWLADFPLPPGTDRVVRAHHERYDGTGFPDGLRGEQIPLGARILGVCEAYVRQMQQGARHDVAMACLMQKAGKTFDPMVVAQFARLHDLAMPG